MNARSTAFIIGWDLDSRTRLVGEERPGRRRISRRPHRIPHRDGEAAAASFSFTSWSGTIRSSTRSNASCFRPRRCVGARRGRSASASTTTCRSAPRSTRRSSWSTTRWRSRGGLDLTTRRWDTREHRLRRSAPRRPRRRALRAIPRRAGDGRRQGRRWRSPSSRAMRWTHGACERAPPIRPIGDPWPQSVTPDLTDIDVGIARTSPALDDESEIREVEALFFDMVDRAERMHLYREPVSHLEALRRASCAADDRRGRSSKPCWSRPSMRTRGWRSRPCRPGLAASCRCSRTRACSERVRFLYPKVADERPQHRHHGAFQGDGRRRPDAAGRLGQPEQPLVRPRHRMRSRLRSRERRNTASRFSACAIACVGHFCGVSEQRGRGRHRAKRLAHQGGASRCRTTATAWHRSSSTTQRPSRSPRWRNSAIPSARSRRRNSPSPSSASGRRRGVCGRFAKVIALGAVRRPADAGVAVDAAGGAHQPAYDRANGLRDIAAMPGGAGDRAGGLRGRRLLVFPVTLLIAATAATFGPWLGFAYAATGAAASAVVTYGVGALIGRETLERRARPAAQSHPPRHHAARRARDRHRAHGAGGAVHRRQSRGRRQPDSIRRLHARHHPRHAAGARADVGARLPDLQHADRADAAQRHPVRAGGGRLDRRLARRSRRW